ncbi:E1 [Castor canadensis papillomavirus 1]|uniref:Replication protein E1 n=1 Tax=Castor canadensis papillomavirus 1 TaxID=1352235 RepID=V9P8E0_9PAPI|nr:E1 [Castor canadensis papillomavirus 1]AGV05016.1 E1 [Castor canadensis papillomavirus 1]
MSDPGTEPDEGCSGWFVDESECVDFTDDTFDELFDRDTDDELSDFIDNADVTQGNSGELFHHQEAVQDEDRLGALKRKYICTPQRTPEQELDSLSPRLGAITLSPPSAVHRAKKRLNFPNDSGIDVSIQNEAGDTPQLLRSQVENINIGTNGGDEAHHTAVFDKAKSRLILLSRFKKILGIGFTDITRTYKSNKTCAAEWVVSLHDCNEVLSESLKTTLVEHCIFFQHIYTCTDEGSVLLMLLRFRSQKSRDTVQNLFRSLLGQMDMLADPPKIRSVPAALYWYKRSMSSTSYMHGSFPEWILQHTMLSHLLGEEKPFELSVMVQWAYDNGYADESRIAYQYALLGDTDENAKAFLASNAQAKYVKDCAAMVRHYLRAEMAELSMSAWIYRRLEPIEDGGDWREIVKFLRFQEVGFIPFCIAFKKFLRGTPKHNCIVFYGPPNTGKSMLCMSLLNVLGGKVISYANSRSHFWLQPLADTKIGLLDDATKACWDYMDVYLRNALDGNPISVDCKHRAPQQIKCPPLLITTNVDVMSDDRWRYLHSRLTAFNFKNQFPFDSEGNPGFALTDANWKSFFTRFWLQLELSDQEDEGDDGNSQQPLRLTTRKASEPL